MGLPWLLSLAMDLPSNFSLMICGQTNIHVFLFRISFFVSMLEVALRLALAAMVTKNLH